MMAVVLPCFAGCTLSDAKTLSRWRRLLARSAC